MQMKQIMTSKPATCRPNTNLAAVAKLMWDRDCGFVPVVDPSDQVVGVITDRDICIASATRRLPPEQILASQVMKRKAIYTAEPDDTVETALAVMKQSQVRRLPVVTADGTLQGVVSMNDLVLAANQKDGPTLADIVLTMAAICAHQPAKTLATA